MSAKLAKLFLVVVFAFAVLFSTACTSNGDWTSDAGNCDNTVTCLYHIAEEQANK